MSDTELPEASPTDAVIAVIRAELEEASPTRRQMIWEAIASAALGSIPWVGGRSRLLYTSGTPSFVGDVMLKPMRFVALFLVALSYVAQAQTVDLNTLVGRKAVAQRMPFYVPGTYQTLPNTYAGKTATIIQVKPSAMFSAIPKLTARQMASLPPASRENIANVRSASTLVIQFEDGTKGDTGAMPVMPNTLATYLELLPDPAAVITPTASAATASDTPTITTPNTTCPVVVAKATSTNGGFAHAIADGLTKSEFERAVEKANAGGKDPHYLDVRMRNTGAKGIRAIEAFVVYADAMGDAGPQTMVAIPAR